MSAFKWLESPWEATFRWMNNDMLTEALIVIVLHEAVYFGRCLPFYIFDRMPSMKKYKIQSTTTPTDQEYVECLKYILWAHFALETPPLVLLHWVGQKLGIAAHAPFPSLWTIAWQCVACMFLEDAWFYWGHKTLHQPYLYKKIHKVHHKYQAPFGLAAEYAHPFEVMFNAVGTIGPPILVALAGSEVHLLTICIWISLRLCQAIDSHGGYDFPISLRRFLPIWAGADHHDDHHHYFKGNYGSWFKHWDYFMGTESAAYTRRHKNGGAWTATERNKYEPDSTKEYEGDECTAEASGSSCR